MVTPLLMPQGNCRMERGQASCPIGKISNMVLHNPLKGKSTGKYIAI